MAADAELRRGDLFMCTNPKFRYAVLITIFWALSHSVLLHGQSTYPRAGWETHLTQLGHKVAGTATIVDERTIRLTHFSYDGFAPMMYVYLATNQTASAFRNHGLIIGPRLARAYSNETHTVQLPEGQSFDGRTAVSIWCLTVQGNFGWGTFAPPNRPMLSVSPRTNAVEIKLTGEMGQRYWLLTQPALPEANGWEPLVLLTNVNGTVRFTNSLAPDRPSVFFRAIRD
jgi:hypothetical protein